MPKTIRARIDLDQLRASDFRDNPYRPWLNLLEQVRGTNVSGALVHFLLSLSPDGVLTTKDLSMTWSTSAEHGITEVEIIETTVNNVAGGFATMTKPE